jgi:hypothetical protein
MKNKNTFIYKIDVNNYDNINDDSNNINDDNSNLNDDYSNNIYNDGYHINNKVKYSLKTQFEGILNPHKDWKQCEYCARYYPNTMYLTNTNYCAHCWGWLNEQQLDLVNLKYTGNHSIPEIILFLKLTYPYHTNSCNLEECIYSKLTKLIEGKKLNPEIIKMLGLNKKNENKNNKNKNKNNKNIIKLIKKDIYINYSLSSISI